MAVHGWHGCSGGETEARAQDLERRRPNAIAHVMLVQKKII